MLFQSINGQTDSHIPLNDRALNYGDGLFTTAKVEHGNICLLTDHMWRLKHGCGKLFINGIDFVWLESYLVELAKNYKLAVLKVVITGGQGGRGYSRVGSEKANIIVTVHDFPKNIKKQQTEGINLGVAQSMLGLNPMLAGLKHLNRLEQVLIRKELDERPEDDLLVLNIHQEIVETSSANIFYQLNGQWFTPALLLSGVNGIMRQTLLADDSDVIVRKDNITALDEVTAMFVCNCIWGIVPIKCFNNTELDIEQVFVFKDKNKC